MSELKGAQNCLELDVERLLKLLELFDGVHLLVVGDVLLDEYLWGDAERISPDASRAGGSCRTDAARTLTSCPAVISRSTRSANMGSASAAVSAAAARPSCANAAVMSMAICTSTNAAEYRLSSMCSSPRAIKPSSSCHCPGSHHGMAASGDAHGPGYTPFEAPIAWSS